MSASFLFNDSLPNPHVLNHESFLPSYLYCYISGTSSLIQSLFLITNICVLLPLCIFILHHGHQQWLQKGSSSSGTTLSHSDCFTYNMVTMDLIGLSGCTVSCCGIFRVDINLIAVGNLTFALCWFGEIFFHVLTCVERYLAVVHPVTYLTLKNEKCVRFRNFIIGCVWLFCITAVVLVMFKMFFFMDICLLVLSLTVASFCSLSVLCVLIHPGPGEQSRTKKADQSKQKAFNTIVAIFGVIVVRFVFNIIWEVVYLSQGVKACLILSCCNWFNLPSSLVLPLLFLHRIGTCMCFKNVTTKRTRTNLQQ